MFNMWTFSRKSICDREVWKTNLGGGEILCQVYEKN
jgi:hypothetical protein